MDEITLRGMTFHALVGVLPHEREHAQPVEIDLTAWVKPGEGVLDYRKLYGDVRAVMQTPALSYLEEIAESIARRVLSHDRVGRVRVVVRKPHAALGGPLVAAEVAIERGRDG